MFNICKIREWKSTFKSVRYDRIASREKLDVTEKVRAVLKIHVKVDLGSFEYLALR